MAEITHKPVKRTQPLSIAQRLDYIFAAFGLSHGPVTICTCCQTCEGSYCAAKEGYARQSGPKEKAHCNVGCHAECSCSKGDCGYMNLPSRNSSLIRTGGSSEPMWPRPHREILLALLDTARILTLEGSHARFQWLCRAGNRLTSHEQWGLPLT
ncbi:Hypothetical predicted protein [Pelobates cultripes]|uniref:Uncharacterized protein n=1 Tax=Pelobates cultripes TaxID=61616 RepID=A0AAD1SIJ5_PELCU|nr:Hypothetical predicted protein [Pelobates cultripes]